MSWSGPMGPKEGDRPTRSVCLKLPSPESVVDGLATFGELLVEGGKAAMPGFISGDPAQLREYAAALLAAADLIERAEVG